MSLKLNPKEINIILNILKGAQFEFLPRAPIYIGTPLGTSTYVRTSVYQLGKHPTCIKWTDPSTN
jgi:hypothetical protein